MKFNNSLLFEYGYQNSSGVHTYYPISYNVLCYTIMTPKWSGSGNLVSQPTIIGEQYKTYFIGFTHGDPFYWISIGH